MRYIYCHPLFDERKCGHRFSYQLARAFERYGLELERFDYQGTGEARGSFCNVTIDSLRKDLKEMAGNNSACIIGTRLGATIAFDYCCQNQNNVSKLVLIEPIVNGPNYVEYLFRKQRLKDMMTGNSINFLHEKGFVNLEGYKTNDAFLDQIRRINLLQLQKQLKTESVFIIQVSACGKLCVDYDLFASDLHKNGKSVCVECFDLPAFWERIPEGDYCASNEKILEWCR